MPQTTVQKAAAIRKGSVRVLIGDDFSSLVDIGALRNPKTNHLVKHENIELDNVPDIKYFSDGKRIALEFLLAEINLTNWGKFDAGLVNVSTVAGSATPVSNEVIASLAPDVPKRLANKNGDNTRVSSIVVTGSGGTPSYAEGTDYEVFVDADGYTNLVRIGATTLTNIEVDYTYTPAASKKVTLNSQGVKVLKAVRIINSDPNSKKFQLDIENATNVEPFSIDFAGDDEADVATVPIKLEGDVKEYIDEQQVT